MILRTLAADNALAKSASMTVGGLDTLKNALPLVIDVKERRCPCDARITATLECSLYASG